MLRAALTKPIPRRATSTSLSAPVGGWNARDSLANMGPYDAVTLENWFPAPTYCQLRNGYSVWAKGITGQVETLIGWHGGANDKFFAAAGANIYNVSTTGTVGAAVVSTASNARWQYINMTTPAGNYVRLFNGADKSWLYDGATWKQDGTGIPQNITGIDTSTVVHCNLFKNRIWMVANDSLDPWYLPTYAVGGAATQFIISAVAKRGGYLMAMATWTIDGGDGMDDLAVFITSKGEVIVYRGTDPSSVTTWALVGVWWLGSPVGRRCFVKLAGDAALICQDGIYPLSDALQGDRLNPRVALSDKIQFAISNAVSLYGNNFGWQLLPFPKQNMLILNVPVGVGLQQQYVMSTIKRSDGDYSWCNLTGWPANCWELYNDNIYFGGNGIVAKAWDGNGDGADLSIGNLGQQINAYGLQAFNYFRTPGREKRFTLMRPTFQAEGLPAVYANILTDFNTDDSSAPLVFSPLAYSLWDQAIWDVNVWAGFGHTVRNWQGTTGHGFCGAALIKVASTLLNIEWVSTDVVYESGGQL